jgi:hypothetical protein
MLRNANSNSVRTELELHYALAAQAFVEGTKSILVLRLAQNSRNAKSPAGEPRAFGALLLPAAVFK